MSCQYLWSQMTWHRITGSPKTLGELVEKYKKRKLNFDRQHETLDKEDDVTSSCTVFILTLCYVSLRSTNLLIPEIYFSNKGSINSRFNQFKHRQYNFIMILYYNFYIHVHLVPYNI